MAYDADMENIGTALQQVSDLLAHAKTMKDRDRDDYKAFKALHAATFRLLEAALLQQLEIQRLKDAIAKRKD